MYDIMDAITAATAAAAATTASTTTVTDRYLQYLQTTPMEFKAMLIAKDHLGSSFDLIRSNGFQNWFKAGGCGGKL
jgi:hypothetical protein